MAVAVDLVLRGMQLYILAMTTLVTESATTEASRLEKQDTLQEKSRKKDRRLFQRDLSKCHTICLGGRSRTGHAQLHFTDIR